jgi:hypothetical protein
MRPFDSSHLLHCLHGADHLSLLRLADSHIRAARDLVRHESGASNDGDREDAKDRVGGRVTEPGRFEAPRFRGSRRCAPALEGQGRPDVGARQKNSGEIPLFESYHAVPANSHNRIGERVLDPFSPSVP